LQPTGVGQVVDRDDDVTIGLRLDRVRSARANHVSGDAEGDGRGGETTCSETTCGETDAPSSAGSGPDGCASDYVLSEFVEQGLLKCVETHRMTSSVRGVSCA
jgi:hypothetical protein